MREPDGRTKTAKETEGLNIFPGNLIIGNSLTSVNTSVDIASRFWTVCMRQETTFTGDAQFGQSGSDGRIRLSEIKVLTRTRKGERFLAEPFIEVALSTT